MMPTGHYERRSIQERLWEKVQKSEGCWLWTGFRDRMGYGRLNIRGIPVLAHRVTYELVNGAIPDGLEMDHLCRVPACVNPSHLEAVTRSVNARRGTAGKVLTWEQVREIRRRYRRGSADANTYTLGREYGVTFSAIARIVTHQTWVEEAA